MTRTVLTTGANSGIGLATVVELARRGFRSVGSVRSEAKADDVAKAAAGGGVEVETVLLDVEDADRCRVSQRLMGEPSQCAAAIAHALEARNPRARYLVGYDAYAIAATLPFAPTAIKDRVSRLTLGL